MQKSSSTEFSKLIDFLMDLVLVSGTSDLKIITFSASKNVERNNIIRKLKKKANTFFQIIVLTYAAVFLTVIEP